MIIFQTKKNSFQEVFKTITIQSTMMTQFKTCKAKNFKSKIKSWIGRLFKTKIWNQFQPNFNNLWMLRLRAHKDRLLKKKFKSKDLKIKVVCKVKRAKIQTRPRLKLKLADLYLIIKKNSRRIISQNSNLCTTIKDQ